nr:hypothetical protein [uncultured Hyphomonas sp.]
MPFSRASPYLRPHGVGWLLLGAIGVLLVFMPLRLHQSAGHMRQVVAGQERLNQDMWRSLPGEPVAEISNAMGEEDARQFMQNFRQGERQSLKAPDCKWAEHDDLFETVSRKGKRIRKRRAHAGDIVCRSLYDEACRAEDRLELNAGTFTTVWHRENGIWTLAAARKRSRGCFSVEGISLENPIYLRARDRLKDN